MAASLWDMDFIDVETDKVIKNIEMDENMTINFRSYQRMNQMAIIYENFGMYFLYNGVNRMDFGDLIFESLKKRI